MGAGRGCLQLEPFDERDNEMHCLRLGAVCPVLKRTNEPVPPVVKWPVSLTTWSLVCRLRGHLCGEVLPTPGVHTALLLPPVRSVIRPVAVLA